MKINELCKHSFVDKHLLFKNFELFIFDKDGTLINHDSIFVDWILNFTSLLKSKFNINPKEIYKVLNFNFSTKKFNFNSIVPIGTEKDIKEELKLYFCDNLGYSEMKFRDVMSKSWYDVKLTHKNVLPCGDIKNIFTVLKNKNIKIAICTSDNRKSTEECIQILGISNYVDVICCGDDPIPSKPSAEPILYICNKLNINPNKSVMIGDTVSDIISAKNAKCSKIIGVLSGNYENTDLKQADLIIQTIDSIIPLFK